MARKFGGTYSPNGPSDPTSPGTPPQAERVHPFHGKVPTRLGLRVNLLFVVPFIFVITAFFADAIGLVSNLVAAGLMLLSAWLTREGIRAQAAFDARTVARRPAIPRKIFASVAIGLGLGIAAGWRSGPVAGALLGLLGAVLHFLSFGPDPLQDKGIEGDDFNSGRVAKAVDNAEAELIAMTAAIDKMRDRDLTNRVARFQITAREMFRTVEQDPRDLTAARKYLGVYLSGAREATEKFVAYQARTGEAQARADYVALLDDLEMNFAAKTETLLKDDRSALDIEMDVLRERLAREPHMSEPRTPQ